MGERGVVDGGMFRKHRGLVVFFLWTAAVLVEPVFLLVQSICATDFVAQQKR